MIIGEGNIMLSKIKIGFEVGHLKIIFNSIQRFEDLMVPLQCHDQLNLIQMTLKKTLQIVHNAVWSINDVSRAYN